MLDIIEDQQNIVRPEKATNHRLTERLPQYEPEIKQEGTNPAPAAEKPSASYSLEAETKRRQRRPKRRRRTNETLRTWSTSWVVR